MTLLGVDGLVELFGNYLYPSFGSAMRKFNKWCVVKTVYATPQKMQQTEPAVSDFGQRVLV